MLKSQKIHRFYLSFTFCAVTLFGFFLSGFLKITYFKSEFWLLLGLFLLIFSLFAGRKTCLFFVVISGFLLSFWRMSIFNLQKSDFSNFEGREVVVAGRIIEDPDLNENGESKLKISVSKIDNHSKNGTIFVSVKTSKKVRRSDEIVLKGKIAADFGGFFGVIWRAKLIEIIPKNDFIRDFRDFFASKIRNIIKNPEVDLGLGFLLGQKNSLPENLEKSLQATSLTHIVVASGYNLTILVNFARRKFSKISKNIATFLMFVFVVFFVMMVGFSPSMVRAGLVSILGIIFWYFGRKVNPYFLLIFISILTIFMNPANLFDLGWQLSFASFFGVLILSPLLQEFLFENPEKLNSIAKIFFETFSAQISTLPLIVMTFGEFSTVAIFANLCVLPLIPLAMLLTFLCGFFAIFAGFIGDFFGFFAENLLAFLISIINFFSKIPNSKIEVEFSLTTVLTYYLILFIGVAFLSYKNKTNFEKNPKNDKM